MDGTRYADGVLVDTTQLSRTEASKSFHILRDRLDNWENGIETGLILTVNPVNTSRVDMSAGTGYAVDGEYVEVLADQLNIQLADTALGAVNWVIAFYTETKTSLNPHETNGTIQPTENKRGIRIRILKPTDFALLPLSDPTFAGDAQDRALLVGIVTATGGALTASNIEQPVVWRSLQYAVMATPPLSGIVIFQVSDNTPEGSTGIIKFDTAPSRLSWQAPGEAGFGASVNVPADGIYTLTALGGSTIQVSVIVAALPSANTQVTVSINGLYTQDVPRMSSTDRHHRSLIGTGIPGPSNPHGLSIDDISPGFATDILTHQQLMHDNGIWRGSSASCLQITIDETPNPDRLLITAPAGDDCYWVHGKRLTAIKNTVLLFSDPTLPAKRALFDIIVDNVGNVKYSQRLEHTGTNLPGDNGIVFMNDEVVAGAHTLSWLALGPGLGGYLAWDNSLTPMRVMPTDTSGLFLLRNGKQEVWFYLSNINDLPNAAGIHNDVITVYATANRAETMLIAQVFWGGNSDGHLGYTRIRGTVPAILVDLRLFGTLRDFNIRDDSLRDMIEYPMDEHHANGVCIGRKDFQGAFGSLWVSKPATGTVMPIWGQAPVYVRGKRYVLGSFTSPLAITVANPNGATVIYIDVDGNVAQVDYTLFSFVNSPTAFDSTKYYKTLAATYASNPWVYTGTPLAIVITSGGNVTRVIDMRRNLSGGNVNIRPWTVSSIVPTLLTPAYQAVEFYSLETAMIYALAQGQEHIECVYATLDDPTYAPYNIPSLKNIELSGTIFIGQDWSTKTSIFQLGDGASIAFDSLTIYQAPSFVGATTLSLVRTSVGSTLPSKVSFTGSYINWLNNGYLSHFIATGPASCSLQASDLVVACNGASAALFQTDVAALPFTLQGITLLGFLGPLALIGGTVDVDAVVSNCAGSSACAVVNLPVGKTLRGSFTGLRDFLEPALGGGTIFRSEWAACGFGGINVLHASKVKFTACEVTGIVSLGSPAAKSTEITLTGCIVENDVAIYADDVEVSGCKFAQHFNFGGEHIQVSATNIKRNVVHDSWASHDVNFSACSMDAFKHETAVDLYDWHIVGGTVNSLVLHWSTEALHNFSVAECSVLSVLFEPTTMPQAALSLDGSIVNCDIDLTAVGSTNIQLSFCRSVSVTNNRIKCIAGYATPPIRLGQGVGVYAQDMHDIVIENNEFQINDVILSYADLGSPVILVADESPAPYDAAQGIVVRGNRFKWSSASASDPAKMVICVLYLSTFARSFRIDDNVLLFNGDNSDKAWNTAPMGAPHNAHRMALFMGFGDLGTNNHICVLQEGTIRGNTFSSSGLTAASKWICYDFGCLYNVSYSVLGNYGSTNNVRMWPDGLPGLAFSDTSLNQALDNVT